MYYYFNSTIYVTLFLYIVVDSILHKINYIFCTCLIKDLNKIYYNIMQKSHYEDMTIT